MVKCSGASRLIFFTYRSFYCRIEIVSRSFIICKKRKVKMKHAVVSGFIFLLLVLLPSGSVEAQNKTKGAYLEVGSVLFEMQPMLWTLGVSLDLPFKNRVVLSPELSLMGSGVETMATPVIMLNYKGGNFFIGAGVGAMLPFTTQDSDVESTFPVLKLNAGFFIGKVKVTLYILRGSGSDYAEELNEVFGISLGIRLRKHKKK